MRLITAIVFSIIFYSSAYSQIVLKPHIGLNSKPLDSDTACYFTPYTGSFNTTGYQAGDTVNDFTLFSYGGDTLNLRRELEKGKPVVLISCSYTCPVFRGKVPDINSLISQYSDSVSIFLIYTIEAHPYIDISPYFGFVNTSQQNISQGILYRLAQNYGDRRYVVNRMDSGMTINAPVFIDGPCDPWLRSFGPAPNNAYLITTQGIVYSKHPWFNKAPLNMSHDIDSLFGITGGGGGQYTGTFNFRRLGDSIVYGVAGETIYGHGEFINNSNDTAIIRAVRQVENFPSGWASSICIDVCYSPETDTAIFYLPPADTQSYTMYFYTAPAPGNGMVRMIFENVNVQNNRFNQRFYASTSLSSISDPNEIPIEFSLSQNYPNPFNPTTNLEFGISELGLVTLKIYDISGKEVMTLVNEQKSPGYYSVSFNGTNLSSGIYFYSIKAGDFVSTKKMTLIK
ncbi:MAG: T9SS type A sorting domain-containing protein [Ignavibacteriae bacterium]|nr:T9SS type A sorting domain-containing protein [Ignavibacteriota bacterium]